MRAICAYILMLALPCLAQAAALISPDPSIAAQIQRCQRATNGIAKLSCPRVEVYHLDDTSDRGFKAFLMEDLQLRAVEAKTATDAKSILTQSLKLSLANAKRDYGSDGWQDLAFDRNAEPAFVQTIQSMQRYLDSLANQGASFSLAPRILWQGSKIGFAIVAKLQNTVIFIAHGE